MKENKVLKFDLDPKTLKVKELLNKDFLELEIKAISTAKPNRNGSHFTLEALAKAIPTFYNKPILGSFSVSKDDFRGHEGELEWDEELDQLYYDYTDDTAETPLGMIRGDDKVEIYHNDKDGLDWLKFTCAIWVKYNYKQVKKLLKSKDGHKKISVEVEVNDYEYDENGIEIIKDFTFDGVTILGDNLETGIADANLTILDMIDNALFQKKQKCLCYAYDKMNKNEISENQAEMFENQDSDKEAVSDDAILNEGVEEIEMNQENQEGGKLTMLTYENKRSLLHACLSDLINAAKDEEVECACYAWICDLDDSYVYFELNEKYYRATYSIIEANDEAEETLVQIDFDNKEQVVRSWSIFSAEVSNDEVINNEDSVAEVFEQENDCSVEINNEVEEEVFSSEADSVSEIEESVETFENAETFENVEENINNSDSVQHEEFTEESQQEVFVENEEEIELNEEPSDVEVEGVPMEEIIEESTTSIVAPEVIVEPENMGDANEEVIDIVEEVSEVIEVVDEIINDDVIVSEEVSVGPDGQEAEIIESESNDESIVEQPDDNEKEKLFTVEVNGENLDINSLLEKYTKLQEDYNALTYSIKMQKAKDLAKFGSDFINADSKVDDESKAAYSAQVAEKCENFEFNTEEEVIKFAKSLLAMYYYENESVLNTKKESSDFSISIVQPIYQQNNASTNSKLKEAINKLNCI